ncbi:HRDC domain-containing protein [Parabacteroides sp. PF5-9]|uniref:HRDC domain-containing protein n=1 Tax=Parabacteroides sp. PF5-9 TaxID=1742404 RepID=UPI0024733ACF|nr:HRDC domain-containing protein [Parabacteroides sp. PF5-9]MDH6357158.1 GTPase SAR1 family protein [Parabacteroides sp. PF5-9]
MTGANRQSDLALDFIQHTGTHIFLTGKAGTGKTTFLRHLKDRSPKRMIVVAPTGVAAINAGGVTIHSFFQLPFGPYIPSEGGQKQTDRTSYTNKFSREKINIIKSIDLLVIDEISMVRADLLDAVSDVLKRYRDPNKPFGGVQLLLIGDLQQLAPVAKEEEWNLLKSHYPSTYFFDSKALLQSEYVCIELTHVYRQNDSTFVRLLNNIRDNQLDNATLDALNARYMPDFQPQEEEGCITLTTHNYQAQQINTQKLNALPGQTYRFKATIQEDFPVYAYPTDEVLELKNGAQVMFIKNDSSAERLYYNGKIGKIVFINQEKIIVSDEFGHTITVGKETWHNVKYAINPETKEISETIAGSFSHYPLKTAWAITIHKSQGLTFDRAIIDAAAAFSHGQVYVALSRCRTLEGLVLSSRISHHALISDSRVDNYSQSLPQRQPAEGQLQQAQSDYFRKLAMELFDFEPLQQRLQYAAYMVYSHLERLYPELCHRFSTTRDDFRTEITEVGSRFQQQLNRLLTTSPDPLNNALIQERISKGVLYFQEKMAILCPPLQQAKEIEIDNKETRKQIKKGLDGFFELLEIKTATLFACRTGFDITTYLKAKAEAQIEQSLTAPKKKSRKTSAAKSEKETTPIVSADILHPQLYQSIREWRNELASRKGVPVYTILQQKALIGITNTLPSSSRELLAINGIGKKVLEVYGKELLELVDKYKASIVE